jgi:DeoR family transcriptional regulator, suf operon transcriptional repressor
MIPMRIGESQARILEHLKRAGTATIPEMGEALGLSVETVRTHLRALGAEGLVERRGRRRNGPGRPEIVYGLTESADALFPQRAGPLLNEFTRFLEGRGQAGLVRDFFDQRLEERLAEVRARVDGLDADARLDEVARVLSDEGFMAEVGTDDAGGTQLRLCHCPVRQLVDVTRAPCRAELAFVRDILGARLRRVSYIPAGDDACCYKLESPQTEV